jgi:HK97 gp10 family phage protein
MATVKGQDGVQRFLAALPANLQRNVLRGALKAGADVIAEAARENCVSHEVREAIKTSSKAEPGRITAKVEVKGEGAFIGPWLEYGTSPHFISVDAEASGGRTARRVNRLARGGDSEVAATLVIGGKPVGKTVHHPGARPHPFLRPALDSHEAQAFAAIGGHVAKKMTKAGINTPDRDDDDA